jgi:eukaryotic-like serine/threonine-protein kinase
MDVCWAAAVGLSVVDPLMSSIFVARHLRLALNSGEPSRLMLGLAAEATQCAHLNDGEQARSAKLLALAARYAQEVNTDYAKAFILTMNAVVDSLSGRWRESLKKAMLAVQLFRERCTGVTWEIGTATSFTFSSRWLLGEWAENARLLPSVVYEAEQNGDRYTAVTIHVVTGYHMSCLASDEPDKAIDSLNPLIRNWPNLRFDVQRLYDFYARVDIALYRGQDEYAWDMVQKDWREARQSGLLRITLLKVSGLDVCGRAATAFAASFPAGSEEREGMLRKTEQFARELDKTKAGYALAIGALLRAGAAISRKERTRTASLLDYAEPILEQFGLKPWLSVARIRRGRLVGGAEGQALWEKGMIWMKSQSVRKPDRLIATLAPGDWNHDYLMADS